MECQSAPVGNVAAEGVLPKNGRALEVSAASYRRQLPAGVYERGYGEIDSLAAISGDRTGGPSAAKFE